MQMWKHKYINDGLFVSNYSIIVMYLVFTFERAKDMEEMKINMYIFMREHDKNNFFGFYCIHKWPKLN